MIDPPRKDIFETGFGRFAWSTMSVIGPAFFGWRMYAKALELEPSSNAALLHSKEGLLAMGFWVVFLLGWPLYNFMRRYEAVTQTSVLPWRHGFAGSFGAARITVAVCGVAAYEAHYWHVHSPLWLFAFASIFWLINIAVLLGLLMREPQLRSHAAECAKVASSIDLSGFNPRRDPPSTE